MIITTPMSAIVLALIAAGEMPASAVPPSHQASVSGAPSPTWERPVEDRNSQIRSTLNGQAAREPSPLASVGGFDPRHYGKSK